MLILNAAGGKIDPLDVIEPSVINDSPTYTVNVDSSYFSKTKMGVIEDDVNKWDNFETKKVWCNEDIFSFMENTILKFDYICIYRFLEHVSFTKVPYFLYLVSTIMQPTNGVVDIIVPNYETLSQRIIDEQTNMEESNYGNFDNFEGYNIELTTELLNEPFCPHASIWTPYRAKYFLEIENLFTFDERSMINNFNFDGRDLYLRFFARKNLDR